MNERERLKNLLRFVRSQVYGGDIEIIIVDNESVDGTQTVGQEFGAKTVTLPREKFTYPVSMNRGVAQAKNEIIILTVGHALPVRNDWLVSAARHFSDEKVAGVYSPVLPHCSSIYPKRTLAEILWYFPGYWLAKIQGAHPVKVGMMGVLAATNCAIRKDFWVQHHFDERFQLGGEDGEWANWAMESGYKIICDWKFAVYHSHGLGFRKLKEQVKYWSRLKEPSTFKREALFFRNDLNFSE